ncbi:hypothetical protein M2171_006489 [Bradyrhizobium japonicum USDA 38]|jgi:hypothetical protein|nr:hypothetical protein [Bradyrhizobium japonicum USDA 38]MCS3949871.1 hypothetical protein [Bradyrhizobium japonicum]
MVNLLCPMRDREKKRLSLLTGGDLAGSGSEQEHYDGPGRLGLT